MNIEITIVWYNNEPAGFWFNDKLIWETDLVITETDLLETKISLPFVEAIKFSAIFIEGFIADRLITLIDVINKQIINLQIIEEQTESQLMIKELENICNEVYKRIMDHGQINCQNDSDIIEMIEEYKMNNKKNAKVIKERMRKGWEEFGKNIDTECTCNECVRKDNCIFAYDLYNFDGDCLWEK